jgi:hypothetical protein
LFLSYWLFLLYNFRFWFGSFFDRWLNIRRSGWTFSFWYIYLFKYFLLFFFFFNLYRDWSILSQTSNCQWLRRLGS